MHISSTKRNIALLNLDLGILGQMSCIDLQLQKNYQSGTNNFGNSQCKILRSRPAIPNSTELNSAY